jgi:predicted nucleic acid-binding protein
MILVDTCGWIEWLTDGNLADQYEPCFEDVTQSIVPTSVQFELYKWVARKEGEQRALEAVALTEQALVVPLSTSIALLAADLSMAHQLSFADAIIYATARFHQAELITSDSHFKGLQRVTFFKKA